MLHVCVKTMQFAFQTCFLNLNGNMHVFSISCVGTSCKNMHIYINTHLRISVLLPKQIYSKPHTQAEVTLSIGFIGITGRHLHVEDGVRQLHNAVEREGSLKLMAWDVQLLAQICCSHLFCHDHLKIVNPTVMNTLKEAG